MAAASALSTSENSVWLTTSWSSSASRLRSESTDSSRLRSYSRAFVIAIDGVRGEQLDQRLVGDVEASGRSIFWVR